MKTVFSNSQCAHVWAQQSQEHGRGSSVSFSGPSFKSYHTTIAKVVRAPSGRDVVLFSSQSYSMTTNGKHKSHAWRAVRGDAPTYTVPTIERGGWNRRDLDHAVNLAYLVDQYREHGERFMRASSIYQEDVAAFHAVLAGILATATAYAADFGLPDPAPREIPPASVAKQITERLDRLQPGRAERALQAAAERAIRNAKREAAESALKRPAWRSGEMSYSYGRLSCEQGGAMLRIKAGERTTNMQGPDIVQTSWGAEAPVSDAVRGMKLWRKCVDAGAVYPTPSGGLPGVRLGHFTLDAIDADGNVTAGCHKFYRAELEHFETLFATAASVPV